MVLSDSEGESNEASYDDLDDEKALLDATIIPTQITCNYKSACKQVRFERRNLSRETSTGVNFTFVEFRQWYI